MVEESTWSSSSHGCDGMSEGWLGIDSNSIGVRPDTVYLGLRGLVRKQDMPWVNRALGRKGRAGIRYGVDL